MATIGGMGKVNRVRDIDPEGNVYYHKGVSDIIFDPIRGVSVLDDITALRTYMAAVQAFMAANPKGMDGQSAYELAVEKGFNGTKKEWLASLKGAKGDPGLDAYQMAVAYYNFAGDRDAYMKSLIGPKGDPGPSAYDYAVEKGYTGSEKQYKDEVVVPEYYTKTEIRDLYKAAKEAVNSSSSTTTAKAGETV